MLCDSWGKRGILMKTELLIKHLCSDMETQLIKITEEVKKAVSNSSIENGVVFIICSHTTCGITINESLECVETDILDFLDTIVPVDSPYTHAHFLMSYGTTSGNSPGHLKQMIVGNNCVLPIKNRKLVLGHAQDIYFTEFDGIKNRKYFIQLLGE